MKLEGCSIAAACLALASCGDGQAGSAYRGEPLMAMSGVVTSSTSALDESLVPALVLRESPFEPKLAGPRQNTTHYVQGEVEGTFPSSFTLRVYDAPPAAAVDALLDGEPAFTLGFITAVSPLHPAWLRISEYAEERDGAEFERDEICSATECYSASQVECPPGEQDPNADWPCGNRFSNGLPWATYGHASNHLVLYVAGPVTAGSVLSRLYAGGGALAQGYHVLVRGPEGTPGGECAKRAQQRALETLNAANGTQWTMSEATSHMRAWAKHTMMALVTEECPKGLTVVRDTVSAPVELELIDQASTTWLSF